MGYYTWTYIRIDKLNDEQTKKCIEGAIESNINTTFGHYSKLTEEEYISKWIKLHKDMYDYFVNECDVPKEHMTDEYLTKDIKNRMKKWFYIQKCYKKVLNGEMKFDEMLHKTHQLTDRSTINNFMIIKHNGYYFVQLGYEIFRNYEYCEEEFTTVDKLIEHCRNIKKPNFIDFKDGYDYQVWDDKIEKNVREYYEAIGDNNFIVNFG